MLTIGMCVGLCILSLLAGIGLYFGMTKICLTERKKVDVQQCDDFVKAHTIMKDAFRQAERSLRGANSSTLKKIRKELKRQGEDDPDRILKQYL